MLESRADQYGEDTHRRAWDIRASSKISIPPFYFMENCTPVPVVRAVASPTTTLLKNILNHSHVATIQIPLGKTIIVMENRDALIKKCVHIKVPGAIIL